MEQLVYQTMKVGRLQTICQMPVIASDSIGMMMPIIVRLSPLRRHLSVDARLDFYAFYVPHRHVYGQEWVDFLTQGIDENISLPGVTIDKGTACLGFRCDENTVRAKHSLTGYNMIWNRYFRYPSDRDTTTGYFGEIPDDAPVDFLDGRNATRGLYTFQLVKYTPNLTGRRAGLVDDISIAEYNALSTSEKEKYAPVKKDVLTGSEKYVVEENECRKYGRIICRLKDMLTTGIEAQYGQDDREVTPEDNGSIDIVDIERKQAEYKSELRRSWGAAANRYTDILKAAFGSGGINIDADQRPMLIGHKSQWLSGYDVDGTGDMSLGQFTGRGIGRFMFGFPRKYFAEHGTIWVMASLRYPTIRRGETNYLTRANLSYKEQSGDPLIIAAEPPHQMEQEWYFPYRDTGVTIPGEVPYGQWYRTIAPGYSHPDYDVVQGYPFGFGTDMNSFRDLHYVRSEDYDEIFQTDQLAHAQFSCKANWSVKRIVPPAGFSINAGAD